MEATLRQHRRKIADQKAQLMAQMELEHMPTPGGPGGDNPPGGSDLQKENDRLRDEINHLCKKIMKLNGEIEGQNTEIQVLRKRLREVQRPLKLDIARLNADIEAAKMREKELEQTVKIKNEELAKLAEQLVE